MDLTSQRTRRVWEPSIEEATAGSSISELWENHVLPQC